jgi:regulator of nucleoside diphosphate kinase
MTNTPIVITHADYQRISDLIDRMRPEDRRHYRDLRHELERAYRVESAAVPADVVTMGSTVRLRELDNDEWWTFTLCYPQEANIGENRISVLAPVGTAILGCRVGDVVDWPVPDGSVRIRIETVLHQPQAAGTVNDPELVGPVGPFGP